jgi:uncharacterized membrane protein YbhN (UPF0104 family)
MFDSLGKFFENISEIHVGALLLALVCQGVYLSLRTRAWYNGLRAAYPEEEFPWRNIWAAEVAGNGISSVIPAHAGAFVRLYLGRHTVPRSNYATIGSSFMVDLPFDILMGTLVLIYGFTQGVFPRLPDLTKLNAFDLSYFANHPRFAIFVMTAAPILLLAAFAWASVRVRDFWEHVRQGVTLLTDRRAWLRGAVVWQALGWCARFFGIWMMLKAFNMPTGVDMVLTVLAVQVAASMIPLTPQGAGVQQALLYSALSGVVAGSLIAAYSVGQQVVIAAFNALFGLFALAVVFRTLDWRGLMAAGRQEKSAEDAFEDEGGYVHGDFDDPGLDQEYGSPRIDDFGDEGGAFGRGGDSATTLEYPADLPDAPRDY